MDFTAIMSQTDSILESQGLYQDISYTDVSESIENYDPITGKYSNSVSQTYVFKAVALSQDNTDNKDSKYGVGMSLIVVPSRLKFELAVDQVFAIGGNNWKVNSFELAPQDTIYQISLRRK